MKIGPLTSQPSFTTMAGSLTGALDYAGVMGGGRLFMPSGIDANRKITYVPGMSILATPFRAGGLADGIVEEYERLSGDESGSSRFIAEAELLDDVFEMSTRDVAEAMRRPYFFGRNPLHDLPETLERLDSLGRYTIGELRDMLGQGDGEVGRLPVSKGLVDEVGKAAWDSDIAATTSYDPEHLLDNDEAANFALIAGVLWMISGDEESKEEGSGAFGYAADIFSEMGFHAAAGIAAEIAFDRGESDRASQDEHVGIVGHWLRAAERYLKSDETAFVMSLFRATFTSLFFDREVSEKVRRKIHYMAAGHNTERGWHVSAAEDYLRLAYASLKYFKFDTRSWNRMTSAIELAIASYEKQGDCGGIVARLKPLAKLARSEARSLNRGLSRHNRAVKEHPDSVQRLRRRAMLRLKHGDMTGAERDLHLADDLTAGDPLIAGDIGLVLHYKADLYKTLGDENMAREILLEAHDYIDFAIEMAEEGKLELPILHARSGAINFSKGERQEAIWDLERALSMDKYDEGIRDYMDAIRAVRSIGSTF